MCEVRQFDQMWLYPYEPSPLETRIQLWKGDSWQESLQSFGP